MSQSRNDVIAWARSQAEELTKEMRETQGTYGGWWESTSVAAKQRISSRAIAALEFLRIHAGVDSEWFRRASTAYDSNGDNQSRETGARLVGQILLQWADHVQSGSFSPASLDEDSPQTVAATDLLEQVRLLNADKDVHVAAPMVLAGAAVEIALRALLQQFGLESPKPGLSSMAQTLKQHSHLTKQDAKDIEQLAGLRNAAAHGEFDELSRERSGLMEQQANLLLARIREVSAN